MRKKRIAFAHYLPVGGAKRCFHSLLPLLAGEFELTVHEFAGGDNATFDLTADDRIRKRVYSAPALTDAWIKKVPILGLARMEYLLSKAYRLMADGIEVDAPDCTIVSHCRYTQSPMLLSMLKQRAIYYCHEPLRSIYEPSVDRPYVQHNGFGRDVARWLNREYARRLDLKNVRSASRLIANSCYSAETLYRVYSRNADPVLLGVDTEIFHLAPTARENIVLSVGALTPLKGHDFVINVLATIASAQRPKLVIISPHGTQASCEFVYLKRLAAERSVETVFETGLSDAQLAAMYRKALVTLYCPRLEPFGLVALESMACGTPVLAVNEGGLRETIVDGVTGFLLPWNHQAFANAILGMRSAPQLCNEMGRKGAAWVASRFTWAACAVSVSRILRETIERK